MATKKAVTVAWGVKYTGGLRMPIAFKCVSRHRVEYVKPVGEIRSRNVMNGASVYAVGGVYTYDGADVVLLLEQTDLMHYRYVTIYFCNADRDLCRRLAELAEAVWKATGNPKLVVAKILETYGNPAPPKTP